MAVFSSALPLTALEFVGGVALGVLVVAALAVVARRLLGLRVGAVRLLFAGAVGYTIAALVSTTMQRSTQPLVFLSVLIGISLLVTMGCLAVAEAVAPSGSRLVRELRRRLARSRRYSQVTAIAIRHGLGPYLRGRRSAGAGVAQGRARLARSLRMALEEGGVTFVKLGQLLSTRRDILPAELIDEPSRLQQRATPAPWPSVRARRRARGGRLAVRGLGPRLARRTAARAARYAFPSLLSFS